MKRRAALRAGAVTGTVALAGCVEWLGQLGLSTPVLVHIENETDLDRTVAITAFELETDRGTYDEAVNAPPDQTTNLGHLTNTDQLVRVVLFEPYVDPDTAGGRSSESGESDDAGEDDGPGEDDGSNEAGGDDDEADTGADDADGGDGTTDADRDDAADEPDEDDDDVADVAETFIGERSQQITIYITADGVELVVDSRE